ncbi:mitofilin family membrane protein [Hoeflea sp. AS60]|uniref:COG4223 family protein n=1 Tax=Hoeflea sp. AS60 TaxID=3135780 RepID=UPI00316C7401
MSKGPTPRHSKSPKPVTIDLDATDVTPKEVPKAKSSATGPAVARTPDPVKPEDAKAGTTGASAAAAGSQTKSDSAAKPSSDPKVDPKTGPTAADTKTPDTKANQTQTGPKQAEPAASQTGPKQSTTGPAGAKRSDSKPAKPESKSGGGIGMVMSSLIGAVIALGGGYALQAGGVLPAPSAGGDQVSASRVDALSSQVETLSQQLNSSTAQVGSDIPARLDTLEAGLANATASAGGDGGDPAAMAQLQERVAGIENKIAELGNGGTAAAADPELAATMNEISAAQSGFQTSMSELRSSSEELSGKIAELEQGQQALAEQLDAPSRQIDLARAIGAAGLKSAIDRGGSFTTELEAFASVAPDDPAVPELRDLAARGIPSRADLVAGFSDAASKAIAAADPGDPDAGLVDRLMSSAMSVVKVRKVGDVQGDSAEAIVARAEARLLNGDIEAALTEWNTLPEASLAATAEYRDALAARASAEKLIAAAMAPSAPSEAPAN